RVLLFHQRDARSPSRVVRARPLAPLRAARTRRNRTARRGANFVRRRCACARAPREAGSGRQDRSVPWRRGGMTGETRRASRMPMRRVRWASIVCCAGFAIPRAALADEPHDQSTPIALGFNVDLLPTILSAADGKAGNAPQVWLGID